MKWADFESRSTITQIESNLWAVKGRPSMKSILISSHFHFGMLSGCSSLHLSAGIILRNIASYLVLHSCPPKLLSQVVIHLSGSRMDGVPRRMGFVKILFFNCSFLGTTSLSLNHKVPSASSWKQATFGSPSRILLLI
jgi:hypothetical protein